MSFRRMPFQFTKTDPVERQRELEKRFGLPSSRNMFVDVANPLSAGTLPRDSSINSSSPRLQHRVPIFVEGSNKPDHSSVDSTGTTYEKKPKVRVIPIEVEGSESGTSTRHRTFSGPAGIPCEGNDRPIPRMCDTSPLKHSMTDLSTPTVAKSSTGSRVHTIPIQVERDVSSKGPKSAKSPKKDVPKFNGCTISKPKVKSPDKDLKRNSKVADAEKPKNEVEISLKKIADVLEEFKVYEAGVLDFKGTTKDKQYRYLDEMLTRCMLKLDDIDTMGNENVRSARKNAVKKVQASIDLLESKANPVNGDVTSSVSEKEVTASDTQEIGAVSIETSDQKVANNETEKNDIEMTEGQAVESNAVEDKQNPSEVEMTEGQAAESNTLEDKENPSEVEMTEGQAAESNVHKDKQNATEVLVSRENSSVTESVKSSDVPEVEMGEIKDSSQVLNSEVSEVEMTDASIESDLELDNSIPAKEDKRAEIETNLLASSNAVPQDDVEMKDVRSTLEDIKESIDEENVVSSSHSEEKCEPDSSNNLEMPLPNTDSTTNSNDTELSQNTECDSDNIVM